MKETISCKEQILRNGSKLYYQFNCDSIWLTLQNKDGARRIIFSMGSELYGYTYRLGYSFEKEFQKSILFRWGCPANGPCEHVLIDKHNGKELKNFDELIYDGEDPLSDFIAYFTDTGLQSLTLDFIDKSKKINIPVPPDRFTAIIPQYQFTDFKLLGNIFKMNYVYSKGDSTLTDSVIVDLKK